ncbi:MAG: Maf family protein, partial [Bacteroidales bacterium]|nr:Maf family protein [Bacteroidales bacterium]
MLSNLKDYHIILGSKSPRRQRLLKEIGIDFEVKVIEEFNESYPDE